jgi:hypothetical protein
MTRLPRGLGLVSYVVLLTLLASAGADALPVQHAVGDSCDIILPGGTKEPGTCQDAACTVCKSVLHPDTCGDGTGTIITCPASMKALPHTVVTVHQHSGASHAP